MSAYGKRFFNLNTGFNRAEIMREAHADARASLAMVAKREQELEAKYADNRWPAPIHAPRKSYATLVAYYLKKIWSFVIQHAQIVRMTANATLADMAAFGAKLNKQFSIIGCD